MNRDPSRDPIERLLRHAGPPPAPAAAQRARAEGAARAAWQRGVRRRRTWRRAAWALAASSALVALLVWRTSLAPKAEVAAVSRNSRAVARVAATSGGLVDPRNGASWPVGADLPAAAELMAPAGVRGELRYADGRSVRIDEGSRLTLADAKTLSLATGAIYVVAAAERGGSFLVDTPLGRVTEEGTSFEVRLAPRTVTIAVRSGRVALSSGTGVERVAAGERLVARGGGAVERGTLAPWDPAWSWTWSAAPAFELEGATLEGFLAWQAGESGRPLTFAPDLEAAAGRRVVLHGSIAGLTPDQALEVVARTVGWRVERIGDGRHLRPAVKEME